MPVKPVITIELGSRQVRKLLSQLRIITGGKPKFASKLRKVIKVLMKDSEGVIKTKSLSGPATFPPRGGTIAQQFILSLGSVFVLKEGTGRLKRSITSSVTGGLNKGVITGRVGAMRKPPIYAGIQHEGGTIIAKGNALVFKIGDRWIIKKSITIRARPYLNVGITFIKNEVGNRIFDALDQQFKEARKKIKNTKNAL